MKIIVGIGNPGKEYAETRHNAGFRVVDRLAREHGIGPWRTRFHSRAAEGSVRGAKVLLMKPETYVNESGRAVRAALPTSTRTAACRSSLPTSWWSPAAPWNRRACC